MSRDLTQSIKPLEAEIAGADRFSSDAKLARAAGIAPIPVSSGNTRRHRLDRGDNRQINAAHPPDLRDPRPAAIPRPENYIARKLSEGKTHRGATRSLKRHLARRIWHLLQPPAPHPGPDDHSHPFFDIDGMCRAGGLSGGHLGGSSAQARRRDRAGA